MMDISIIFPNQIFENSKLLDESSKIFLIEEYLFFNQFNFHKQKILFHRMTMKSYEKFLKKKKLDVVYIDSTENISDIREFIRNLDKKIKSIKIYDPVDNWLSRRINDSCEEKNIKIENYNNPLFINNNEDLETFFRSDKKKFFQTSFYKKQRVKLDIMMIGDKPEGGKWTYDDQNREKYPKNKIPPEIDYPKKDDNYNEALNYLNNNYKNNYGLIDDENIYPYNFQLAKKWLDDFFITRFYEFGPYEDAVVKEKSILNHSVLSPLLNTGLINPKELIKRTINYHYENKIPINSTEGFIRQIIGWREFIRGVYVCKGTEERNKNFWKFSRKIPSSFYSATTGIDPVDDTINKINKSGYANHIERLMIIGNFMLLCEFDPNEVYRWFMELFIDSYDWVMVPNVYGMSQFGDGGLMSTKPYISGSSYILKMSNYKRGDWCMIWDSLFWNFIDKQREFFLTNPRMRMLVSSFDRMDIEKKEKLINTANKFISNL
ncbi:MAG: cryptochrome/photolyase family protein [Cryomorphaceae bacterium]|nr:MAG: cryptochrome/photolyase family protein [Cryomorphaceae bacterium]